ncbi:MAG: carboxypeptidase-like regulatory domain-containing protein [Kineosporiaceae bacterium]
MPSGLASLVRLKVRPGVAYTLRSEAQGDFATTYYTGSSYPGGSARRSDAVPLTTPVQVSFHAVHAGDLLGVVRGADLRPAGAVSVTAVPTDPQGQSGRTVSAADGSFSFTTLPEGHYRLKYEAMAGSTAVTQWSGGAATEALASTVTLAYGHPALVPETLSRIGTAVPTATLYGTSLIPGYQSQPQACVVVQPASAPATGGWTPTASAWDCLRYGGALTDADSHYRLTVPLRDTSSATVVAFGNGRAASSVQSALVAGEVRTLDLPLQAVATVAGAVLGKGGRPIAGVCPRLHVGRTQTLVVAVESWCSDAKGQWSLRGLPKGDYTVELLGTGVYATRYWPSEVSIADARLLTVDAVPAGWTFAPAPLPAVAVLQGRITDQAGAPVSGAVVTVARPLSGGGLAPVVTATTDVSGRYRVMAVPEGSAVLQVVPPRAGTGTGLAWRGRGSDPDALSGKPFTFTDGKAVTFNAVLRPSVSLAVTLSSLPAGAVGGVTVDPVGSLGTPIGWGATVTAAGVSVTLSGFPAGTVRLRARWTDASGQVHQAWFGGTSPASATPVAVGAKKPHAVTVAFG